MTHHITLSVETEWPKAEVRTALSMLIQQTSLLAIRVQILDDHGPERRGITLDDLAKVRDALQIGQEAAEELLARHDTELGRTTRSNRLTAETMEADVKALQGAINFLQP